MGIRQFCSGAQEWWAGERGGAKYGWEGWVVITGAEISHTLRFMYCFDSLRQPMLPQEYQDPQTTVEAQDRSHDINTGKMFSSLEQNKERGDASCFFSVVTVLAQFCAVPVHGYPCHHLRWHQCVDCWSRSRGAGRNPRKGTVLWSMYPLSTTHMASLHAVAIINIS